MRDIDVRHAEVLKAAQSGHCGGDSDCTPFVTHWSAGLQTVAKPKGRIGQAAALYWEAWCDVVQVTDDCTLVAIFFESCARTRPTQTTDISAIMICGTLHHDNGSGLSLESQMYCLLFTKGTIETHKCTTTRLFWVCW